MAVFVGLDIGGTKIMVAAADREGNILRRARKATSTSLEEDLSNINNMITEVAMEDKIMGMGAAIGGPLDWEQGIVSPLPPTRLAKRTSQSDDGGEVGLSISC
jgi:glucokinase